MNDLKMYPPWREAIKVFIESGMNDPGTVITEEWKLKQFGIEKPKVGSPEEIERYKLKLMSAFEAFREELLTGYQIHLKPVGKGAHIVLAPNEQTREAWNSGIHDVKKIMMKMKARLENVNHVLLTAEERRENVDTQARYAMFSSMFRKVRKMEVSGNKLEELE